MASDGAPKLAGMKYLVESILSTGEKDTVMRIGDQGNLGKPYALKVIRREDKGDDVRLACARAAVEASPKLGHPALLHYHDFRLRKAWLVVVKRGELLMEFVDGQSLDHIKGLKIAPLALIFRQVAAAVAHMHRRGVRHGDIKPSHIMLARNGQVKVLGYGLSIVRETDKESPLGTKAYMAPEQSKGRALDEKTDIYSLGATMYHLLTGRPFPRRDDGEGKAPAPAAVNHNIPIDLSNLVVSCLSSHPPKRPEDMTIVRDRLDAIVKTLGVHDDQLKGLAKAEKEPSADGADERK
jgi:serine/threonine-protein kinase